MASDRTSVDLLDEAWARQLRWSRLARRMQSTVKRARLVNLGLLVVGASAGALAAQRWLPPNGRVAVGVVAAVALAVAGIVQQRYLTPEAVGRWPLARAVSEAIKAEVFRHLAGTRSGDELRVAVREAERRSEELRAEVELGPEPAATAPPPVRSLADYVEVRARSQQRWHRGTAVAHLTRAKGLHRVELATTLLAAALAAAGSVVGSAPLSAWVAAATTVAATVAAHVVALGYARTARTYLATADRLDELIEAYQSDPAVAGVTFVDDVEQVLLTQNQGWAALVRTR